MGASRGKPRTGGCPGTAKLPLAPGRGFGVSTNLGTPTGQDSAGIQKQTQSSFAFRLEKDPFCVVYAFSSKAGSCLGPSLP